jgi:hypothetical protein
MPYSDFYLKSRSKTPFFLYVLAFLAVGGFATVLFRPSTPSVSASKENVVYHTVANVSSHQAAVYYQTTNPTPSWVIYGTNANSLDKAAFDDRDSSDHKTGYYLHYVLLKDLQENTSYSYKIIADGEVVSINNVDTFTFTTPPTLAITTDSSINPAYGKVIEQNNQKVSNGFIIYYYPNAYPLVSPISGGDWLISLTSLINRDTNKPIQPNPSETVKVEIINEELKSTSVETALGNTTPLSKTVIIGTPFSDNKAENILGAHINIPNAPSPTKRITSSATVLPKTSAVNIIFPKEKAIIPGNQPLIKGTAAANTNVSLTLRTTGQTILSTKVATDEKGEWKLSLPMPLKAASYTLTAITDNGLSSQAVSRTFSTTKSGEEIVLGTATASATLTPESPTVAPTLIAEATPTTAVVAPTAQPTYAVSTTPPVTGQNNTAIMVGSLFLVVIAAGIILFI